MFVVLLTYVKPLSEVDRLRDAHLAYLQAPLEQGVFVLAGRQVPRAGGVILATGISLAELRELVAADPFVAEGVADVEIIEFRPGHWHPSLSEVAAS